MALSFIQSGGGPQLFANGTGAAPSIAFALEPTTGLYKSGTGEITITLQGSNSIDFTQTHVSLKSSGQFAWSSTTDPTGALDTGFSRGSSPNTVKLGNGTVGDASGSLLANNATLTATAANGYCVICNSGNSTNNNLFAFRSGGAPNTDVWIMYLKSGTDLTYYDTADRISFMGGSTGNLKLHTGVLQFGASGDSGVSRTAAGVIAIGNGTAADVTGSLQAAEYRLGAGSSAQQGLSASGASSILRGSTVFLQGTGGAQATAVQINATSLTLINPTAATSGVSQSSPTQTFSGQYWTGAASAEDKWTIQNIVGNGTNGTSLLTFAHTGTTGDPSGVRITGSATSTTAGAAAILDIQGGTSAGNLLSLTSNGVQITYQGSSSTGWFGTVSNSKFAIFTNNNNGCLAIFTSGGTFLGTASGTDPGNDGTNLFNLGVSGHIKFASTSTGAYDNGISRLGASSLAIGNGAAGDFTGQLKFGNAILSSAAATVAAAQVGLGSTTATTANTGANGAPPAQVAGYLIINVAGTAMKVPYYAN